MSEGNIPKIHGGEEMPEEHSDQVWYGMVDSERVSRYYMALADKMTSRHYWWTFGVLVTAAGVPASLAFDLPDWATAAISTGVIGITIWTVCAEYSRKAVAAAIIADRCRILAQKWKSLWVNQKRYSTDGFISKIETLNKRMEEATASREIAWIQLRTDDKIHKRCTHEAETNLEFEFKEQAG